MGEDNRHYSFTEVPEEGVKVRVEYDVKIYASWLKILGALRIDKMFAKRELNSLIAQAKEDSGEKSEA